METNDSSALWSRRRFTRLTLSALGLMAVDGSLAACRRQEEAAGQPSGDSDQLKPGDLTDRPFDAGPAADFIAAGVYVQHRHLGVWIVSNGRQAMALSAICPHLGCLVNWSPSSQQFVCPCHSSRFEADGSPLPDQKAKRALFRLATIVKPSSDGSPDRLWVDPGKILPADALSSGESRQ